MKFDAKDYELSHPDSDKVQELFEELEFRRLKDQFIKLFSGEAQSNPTPISASKSNNTQNPTAGAGQFSLFGGDTEKIEATSSRKNLKDTAHVYQSLSSEMAINFFFRI